MREHAGVATPETAVRVAALCLDGKGRLSQRLVCSTAVRAGLLVDLALAGRLEETADSIALDDSPTGVVPLDQLLQGVTPGTTLDAWLELPRPTLRDLAEEAVRSGRWELRRGLFPGARFLDLDAERTAADRARDPADAGPAWTAADAAVTAIAHVAGVRTTTGAGWYGEVPADPLDEALLAATGPLRWLCTAVTEHLAWARARDATAAQALRSGDTVGPG
jgi:hypothetical protein